MAAPATFESFSAELSRLTGIFEKNLTHYKKAGYDEASLRQEFLNPLFAALGWDVENKAGHIPQKREVEVESRTQIGGRAKRADYLFRTDGRDRFVCEAKKPAVALDAKEAFQAKRYAWNKDLPLAVLTDFEEMIIYVVGGKPRADEPEAGEWKSWHFKQYPLVAQEMWDLLSREKVGGGAIDAALDALPKKKSTGKGKAKQQWLIRPDRSRSLDHEFLEFLDESRRDLASDLYKHNDHDTLLEGNLLNESVQCILDRILFLRICEDRDIDTGTTLQNIVETWRRNYGHDEGRKFRQESMRLRDDSTIDLDGGGGTAGSRIAAPRESLWYAIVRHFRALDRRPAGLTPFFNGNLFKPHGSEKLILGDEWLADFIGELSNDETPYLFNVIPVEILGSVYERFLGKVVRPHGKGIIVEEKPEVRKAGGVYYTPRYIVDYIVEQTVGRQLDESGTGFQPVGPAGVTPATPAKAGRMPASPTDKMSVPLRILDPACGSGSFLIRAFERVCEHWQEWLTAQLPKEKTARAAWEKKHRKLCWVDAETGDIHLTVDLKRRILTENIYGVDLDSAAVEVTQLSLYLKMLENENRTTLQRERELFADEVALLPPLQDNIKCGNSLIASDFSMMSEDLVRVNAFDWDVQFRDIMKVGGFDAVIGNPPYLNIDDTWGKGDMRLEAIKLQYPHIYNDKTDILFYFIAKAHALSKNRAGFIVSRAFLEAFKADKLRGYLATNRAVAEIVDFQNFYVFDGVGITTCVLQMEKAPSSKTLEVFKLRPTKLPSTELPKLLSKGEVFEHHTIARSSLNAGVWNFAPPAIAELNAKIDAAGETLGKILHIGQGMQTGCNEVFGERTLDEIRGWKVPQPLYRFRAANSDIQRFEVRDREEVLLYLEEVASFDKLPAGVRQHLESCAASLKARAAYKRGNCDWWRFTWPLHREYYSRARLVCPFLATENRFALVEDGRFIGLTDSTVLFENRQPESLKYLLGLLNSKLLTFRFRSIGKLKGGGIYEYFWNSISKLPIRRIDFKKPADKARHDKLVMLVEKMLALTPKLRAAKTDAEKATLQNAVSKTDHDIDALVYELYALTPDEIALVEGKEN